MMDPASNPLVQLPIIPWIFIIFIFYFLVFKPQKNKDTQRKQMLANLKKNDEVVTVGGIHGRIVNIKETTATLRIDDNVKVEIDKEAVSSIKKSESAV